MRDRRSWPTRMLLLHIIASEFVAGNRRLHDTTPFFSCLTQAISMARPSSGGSVGLPSHQCCDLGQSRLSGPSPH
ncbi:hypothetical protein KC329_g34 [Hortaea werneckii]|nr:hypothetical protein KC329_g34 [Hortaea werneckii]